MKNSFTWFALLIVALVITACKSFITMDSDMGTITGSVNYRERLVLPDNARIVVSLVAIPVNTDSQPDIISQHAFLAEGAQPPVSFTLRYLKQDLKPTLEYRIDASIEVNENVLFSNQSSEITSIDPLSTSYIDILLNKHSF